MMKWFSQVVLLVLIGVGVGGANDASKQAAVKAALASSSLTFREVAAGARPMVVHIRTRLPRGPSDLLGEKQAGEGQGKALFTMGSGVLVDSAGFILTSYHVVRNAIGIRVLLSDRREYDAGLISFDPRSDLAMLKIDADRLSSARLGNSDAVEVGDWVIAIGSPLGLEQTVTAGIISATGRDFMDASGESYAYQDFIQTDAAVNAGSSGGPLLNLDGEVIAITHKRATGSGAAGLAFATPINLVKNVLTSMKQGRGAPRGQLGVGLRDVNQSIAEASGLSKIYGAQVQFVKRDSPASAAGVRTGDIILEVNRVVVRNRSHLRSLIASFPLQHEGVLKIFRSGDVRQLSFTLEPGQTSMEDPNLGLSLINLNKRISDRIGLERPQGALVASVTPQGPAMKAGIGIGMVVVAVNNLPVADIGAYGAAIKQEARAKSVNLFVYVRGKLMVIRFQRGADKQFHPLAPSKPTTAKE